jgi:hypothetical protein
MFFNDFTRFVLELEKTRKLLWVPDRWVKMASSPPVMVPDSTDRTHPFAHTLKRFVNPKPPRYLKVSLSAIDISTKQEPTTIDTNTQVDDRKYVGEA